MVHVPSPVAPGAFSRDDEMRRPARPLYRVFVSSTWMDLQPERRALMEALNRMDEMRFVGMEFFGNRPSDTHEASIEQVDACDLLIGVIGFRYGSGITEAEYRRARARGLPCFIYLKRDAEVRPELTDNDPSLAAKLGALKDELRREHTLKEFSSPEELAAAAIADLHNWVAARWVTMEREPRAQPRMQVAADDPDRTNLLRLLDRVDGDWIRGVLEASLHHRARLELGLDWREGAVEHPWGRIVVAPQRPIGSLPKEESIAAVFAAAQDTLLVLGEPGAGKTTTALELARQLSERARNGETRAFPVVLALSTWRGTEGAFAEWLVAELGLRYQVPKRLARSWLEEGRLVLILDGLDEVAGDRRAACVAAINAFEEDLPPGGLVVTCRVAEYEALAVKLKLRAAICLQPLTLEQVDRYFASGGEQLAVLRNAVRDDPELRELARTPLMLSVMTMACGGIGSGSNLRLVTEGSTDRLGQLFEAYIAAALQRRGKAPTGTSAAQAVAWLSVLAARMKEQALTLFTLEHLQPGWIVSARGQLGYMLATRLGGCLTLALPILLFPVSPGTYALVMGMAFALGLALTLIDFSFLRARTALRLATSGRFWITLGVIIAAAVSWVLVFLEGISRGASASATLPYGLLYFAMVAFAFCAPVDVRAVDIRTSEAMTWSWRQALERFWAGVVGLNVMVAVVFLVTFISVTRSLGWDDALPMITGWWFWGGIVVGGVAGGWLGARRWTKGAIYTGLAAVAGMSITTQLFALMAAWTTSGAIALLLQFSVAAFAGVFGGFRGAMVDPLKTRTTGWWYWLRVPTKAFITVAVLMMIPGLVSLLTDMAAGESLTTLKIAKRLSMMVAIGGCTGVVAFLRFGGFNGLQHALLRWVLVRDGSLPPRAEQFFDEAARMAVLQRVGRGYRFVHALLLDHFARSADRPQPKGN